VLLLTYFLIAVGISFICSILEAVLLSVTPSYIQVLKETNPKDGKRLEKQKLDIDKSIGSILTLNTFAHTLGAAGVGAEAARMFGDEYMFYISAVLTILILVFSEIIPKTIGAYYWKELSPISSRVIQVFVFITTPLLIIMNQITKIISGGKDKVSKITKEELEATISMSEKAGLLKEKDSTIIENILELNKIKVKDIHTPRSVLFCLSQEQLAESLKQKNISNINIDKVKEYSRIPIFGKDIDDITGIVLSKEYFYEYISEKDNIESIVKTAFFINENIPVSKLLDLFIEKKEHMFIVVDAYDQTEGIVTLEDALEALLGIEIVDELDHNIDMRELAKNIRQSCKN
jgi:CBS domain containing-hemolysin-like protein